MPQAIQKSQKIIQNHFREGFGMRLGQASDVRMNLEGLWKDFGTHSKDFGKVFWNLGNDRCENRCV